MTVREAMNPVTVTVGSGHTMREAARRMSDAGTGAAVVIDHDLPAPGIVTERDLLRCAGHGDDLDAELVGILSMRDIVGKWVRASAAASKVAVA